MKSFPDPGTLPALEGLVCKQLAPTDAASIMTLQAQMLTALPDSTWYYPSDYTMFADCCQRGESFGFFSGETLAGFGTLTPWYARPDRNYALKVGDPVENTYDFQDVMVSPLFRRRGIHSALLDFFEHLARDAGGVALYCTIAPDNIPSVRSFEKAGYQCILQKPAYEGMLRGYFRKRL